ncbi:MAG: glycosyltransferase family 39 protein, partial [Pirellulaceae bacterium]
MNQSSRPASSRQADLSAQLPVNLRWIVIAWSLLVVYLVLFFWSDQLHRAVCWLFLVPDELILQWTGGDWLRFSLLDRFPLLFLAAAMLLSAGALGRLILRPSGLLSEISRAEGLLFSLAVGLSCLSLCTLALGWAGWLQNRSLFLCLLGLPVLVEAVCLKYCAAIPPAVAATTEGAKGSPASASLSKNWLWLLAPLTLVVLLGGMLPPQDFDVREYHLQVPKEWYLNGRVEFLPHNVYGNMPLGSEVLSIPAMAVWPGENDWWWGALVGKTILASFGLLTAWAVYLFGCRWFSSTAALVSTIVFLGTPWVLYVCMNGLVEVAVAFYGLMALYATLLWRQRPERLAWAGLAGFLAGSAVACKYPAILLVVFPLLIYLAIQAGRRRPAVLAVFLVAVSLGCGLWFAKNLAMTGNPTYPLLGS